MFNIQLSTFNFRQQFIKNFVVACYIICVLCGPIPSTPWTCGDLNQDSWPEWHIPSVMGGLFFVQLLCPMVLLLFRSMHDDIFLSLSHDVDFVDISQDNICCIQNIVPYLIGRIIYLQLGSTCMCIFKLGVDYGIRTTHAWYCMTVFWLLCDFIQICFKCLQHRIKSFF